MKKMKFSRNEILKLSGSGIASLAMNPFSAPRPLPSQAIGYVRVSVSQVRVFKEPSYQSEVLHTYARDELVYIYEKLISPLGPNFNPRWYRVEEGYIHTAYLQPVDTVIQRPSYSIKEGGEVGEITVPMTQSFRNSKAYGWQPLYRLYYLSTHWVTGIDLGPNNQLYYKLTDELLRIDYWVAANHIRIIPESEMTPISPEVPAEEKHIEVNRSLQSMTVFEGKEVVLHTEVSTGIPSPNAPADSIPTITPLGYFNVHLKMPFKHMGDGKLTSDINAYELPGVPWVSFFHETGVAFHGTYWHDNYGNEMSHGCVNMRPDEAKWLWRWVTPTVKQQEWIKTGFGTSVRVI
jgi:hypothetical protein